MNLSEILQRDAAAMYGAAEGLFGRVDDLDWKPATGENWLTTRQLLRHTAEACGHTRKGYLTGEWGMEADTPPRGPAGRGDAAAGRVLPGRRQPRGGPAAARGGSGDVHGVIVGAQRRAAARRAERPPWGGPERTLLQHLQECIWHLGQHKGQLFYYVKLQGKDVNTMDLWAGGA